MVFFNVGKHSTAFNHYSNQNTITFQANFVKNGAFKNMCGQRKCSNQSANQLCNATGGKVSFLEDNYKHKSVTIHKSCLQFEQLPRSKNQKS